MPSPVVYTFIMGGRRRELFIERELEPDAVCPAVESLHGERAKLAAYSIGRVTIAR